MAFQLRYQNFGSMAVFLLYLQTSHNLGSIAIIYCAYQDTSNLAVREDMSEVYCSICTCEDSKSWWYSNKSIVPTEITHFLDSVARLVLFQPKYQNFRDMTKLALDPPRLDNHGDAARFDRVPDTIGES